MADEYLRTTSKSMYKSLPAEGDYPHKRKYRAGWTTAPHYNRHSDNQGKNKHKVPNPTSYATPKVMVLNATTGKKVMMTRAEFAAMDRGWEIKDKI